MAAIKYRPFGEIEAGDRAYIAGHWREISGVGTYAEQGSPEVGWISGEYEPQEEAEGGWQIAVFPDQKVMIDKTRFPKEA